VSVLSSLRAMAYEGGIAVLCSLHHIDWVLGFADRGLDFLRLGRLVTDNTIEKFRSRPAREIYEPTEGEQ
jgi:ABC-type phosphate/phosphonate transport system ATPase subunit